MKMRFLIDKELWGITFYIESDTNVSPLADDEKLKTSIFGGTNETSLSN